MLVAGLFLENALGNEFENKLSLDIKGAEHSILASLISHRSTDSKYLCAENLYACTGVDGAELGLSLIGGNRSAAAPRSLIELARFRLDAGLSSDFKCYISYRGNDVARWIDIADPENLADQCQNEVKAFKKRARGNYDAQSGDICRTPKEVASTLRELKVIAKSGAGCE
jgi:hypothetical protein